MEEYECVKFHILGIISDSKFQKCQTLLKKVASNKNYNVTVQVEGLVETEFELALSKYKQTLAPHVATHTDSPLIFYNGKNYVGGESELLELLALKYLQADELSDEDVQKMANIAMHEYRVKSGHTFCYLVFGTENSNNQMRVELELYTDICPKTCENFRQLCTKEARPLHGKRISYLHNTVHRIVHGGWIQMGDIINNGQGDGSNYSIYGGNFEDECFDISHDRMGILSMANDGPHSNSTQFFITLAPQKWIDHKKVAFGKVIVGMKWILELGRSELYNQRPVKEIKIIECGQIKF